MASFANDGYPTEAALKKVRKWPLEDGLNEALEFVVAAWHFAEDGGVRRELRPCEQEMVHAKDGEQFLRLATCGWSGNEDLIEAMAKNFFIWSRWRLSASGGLHIFEFMPPEFSTAVKRKGMP